MPKVCSNTNCKRVAEGKFTRCFGCKESTRKSHRKRKERASRATGREGHKYCKVCYREFPLTHFQSSHTRREKTTVVCATCRVGTIQKLESKTTKKGKCRQVYLEWKRDKICELCGYQGDCIEADHREQKIHTCGDTGWWAWNGGVSALEAELKKCRPLCRFCHRFVSQQERGIQKQRSQVKKKQYVNTKKLMIGTCALCDRKLVDEQYCCCFDFDHIETELKRNCIGKMVNQYSLKTFFQCIDSELAKCRLLCANCHMNHTNEQRKQKRLKLEALLKSEENKVC